MGLARHLDQASAYSPIIEARIRSRTSRARAKGVERELGQPKGISRSIGKLGKDYYYGSGSRGGAGAQREPVPSFHSGLFYAPPDSP